MDAAVTREVLRDLDALIVVSSPWADGAAAAAKTVEWLSDHDLGDLLQRSVVVLNDSDGHADKRTRSLLAREFVDHGQPVVEVPFDPHLRPGGVIDVSREMAPATRLKFLQVAATITGYFASRTAGPRNRPSDWAGQAQRADGSAVASILVIRSASDGQHETAKSRRSANASNTGWPAGPPTSVAPGPR